MLVSAISNLSAGKTVSNTQSLRSGIQSSSQGYYNYNYFGAKKEYFSSQTTMNEMFHKIALWREFCENEIINDESQTDTFNYLA